MRTVKLLSLLIISCYSAISYGQVTFSWNGTYGGAGTNRTYTGTPVSGITMTATMVNSENVWQDASPAWFPTGSVNPGGGCAGITATNQGMLLSTDWTTNTVKTITTTITFSSPVQGPVNFKLFDINDDGFGSWEDRIIVTGTNSSAAPVNIFKVGTACVQTGGSVTGSGTPTLTFNSGISTACTCWGNNEVNVGVGTDCISTITIQYRSNTAPTNYNNPKQYVVISNLTAFIPTAAVAPTGITGTASICSGQSTTLTATGGNASSQWYTGSCAGTLVGTGTSITVSPTSNTTYYVANPGGCNTLSSCASLAVNVAAPVNAGTDGSTAICETSGAAIDLFSLIGGEQAGGTWSQTSGSGGTFNAGAGTFTPAVGATTSTFQYLINGVAPCANDLSVATITINPAPNAGTNGTVSVCSNGSSINLFSSLGGSPAATGTWSGGLTGGNLGTYNPAVLASGTYTYTVTAAGCTNATATVTVTENVAANAGIDGSNAVCESSGAAIDLYSLISGEQAGGTWSQTSGSGGTFNAGAGTFTPAVGATTSTFQYLINGVAPCTNDFSVATITINPAPNAGTNGTVSICSNNAPINLFSSLGGSPAATGTWSGGLTGGNLGTYDPAVLASGTYTYTVTAAGCTNATATVTVTENLAANAGTDGSTTVCESSGAAVDLFSLIGGEQAGGTWSQTSGTGGTFVAGAGSFTPAIGATSSTFQYLINGVAPCVNDLSVATITIVTAPNAGTNGTVSICSNNAPINLFTSLGGSPAATGTWSGGLTGGNLGTYDPAVLASGTYTYTVTAAGCTNATATVNVTENLAAIAGTDGSTTVCESSGAAVDLFSLIGGEQVGGTWSQTSGSGGTFVAGTGTFTPAIGATSSTFQYLINGVAPCVNDLSVATITIVTAPNAGTNGTVSICSNNAPINLFASLGGSPAATGTWSGGLTGGNLGTYDPAVLASGTYTYTVTAAGCTNATATVTVTENLAANAGTDGSTTVCESSGAAVDLFSLIGGEQVGGTWSQTSGSGGTFVAGTGTFTPAIGATSSTFQYLINGVAPCVNDLSVATITIVTAPNAGTNGTVSICSNNAPINLFSSLGGSPAATGTWSGGLTGGNLGTYDPAVLASGTYTYTVTAAGCTNATATVTVTENLAANAGTDGSTTVCESSGAAVDLFSLIGGEQAGGTWSQTSGTGGTFNAGAGTFTPAIGATSSTFQYLINGVAPCVNDLSIATITIVTGPNAGTNGAVSICSTGTSVNLFTSLGGTPSATGTWSGGLTGGNLGTYDPSTMMPGTFTYTVSAAGCADATATVNVTETPAPNAGANGTVSVCETGSPINLFTSLTGTPDATGTWSGGLTGGNLGTYDPNILTAGTYTYTVSVAGCSDATATVAVTETPGPDAGSNGAVSVCESGSPIDLFVSLVGTPDATGTWSGGLTGGNLGTYDPLTMSQGSFTYTVSLVGCADALASVIVTEMVAPNAGTNGTLTVCAGTVPTNAQLLAALGGTPDAGGSWSNTGLVYTYTVAPTSPCAIADVSTVTITETSVPGAPAVYSDTTYCSGDALVDMNVVGGSGTFTWYSSSALTNMIGTGPTLAPLNVLGTTVYYVTETFSGCQGPADSVMITIAACSEPDVEIVIPTAFTPNSDGMHDGWELVNIDEKYPDNIVYIYNRWGNLIFESIKGNYNSSKWDGTFKDKPMPVGSYYYIIYTTGDDSGEILKGIVTIVKN